MLVQIAGNSTMKYLLMNELILVIAVLEIE